MLASVQPGDLVGKTEVKRRIGQGSMGSVFLGHHMDLGIPVALKMLNVEFSSDEKARERFLREGQLQAQLDHPNICRVHAIGNDSGCYYLVQEFVEGVNLREVIRDKALPPTQALKVLWDLGQALKYIHAKGLIHRDIKPSNVMIRKKDSSAVLMDFGLVRPKQGSKLTAVGTIMGTANYMPPEQANPRGKFGPINPKSDLYSLGATFYRLITGVPPYAAKNPIETIMLLLKQPLRPPREVKPDISAEIEDICLWCMEKAQDERIDNAERLLEALVAFTRGAYKIRPPKPKPVVRAVSEEGPPLATTKAPRRKRSDARSTSRSQSGSGSRSRKSGEGRKSASGESGKGSKARRSRSGAKRSSESEKTRSSEARRARRRLLEQQEAARAEEAQAKGLMKSSSVIAFVWILSGILFACIVLVLILRILGD